MKLLQMFSVLGVVAICLGCNAGTTAPVSKEPSAQAAAYLLTEEPAAARSVTETKESAQDGEEVTLVGRIGGSENPFVSGRASFTIVDEALIPCSEREGDSCKTPWDYCCDTDRLPAATAVVKVVDDAGKTVALDAKKELGMTELQTVVVTGKAKRDETGNLTVLAPAIYVKK